MGIKFCFFGLQAFEDNFMACGAYMGCDRACGFKVNCFRPWCLGFRVEFHDLGG